MVITDSTWARQPMPTSTILWLPSYGSRLDELLILYRFLGYVCIVYYVWLSSQVMP
jgi:hypothetical protein